MKRGWRQSIVGGIALTAAIALASTMVATSARADRAPSLEGALVGGVIGGLLGSTFENRSDRLFAIGAGAMLGSLYGAHGVGHRHHGSVYHRPMHDHRKWHDRRAHKRHWQVQPRRHHHGHHHHGYHRGWKRPHAHTPAWLHPRPRERHHHHRPVYGHNTHRDCRVLEHGARPVVACRGRGGHWRILQ